MQCNGEFKFYDYYIIKTNQNLSASNGPYKLSLFFIASYEEYEAGLFEINFSNDNINSTMIATKFEPLDARKAL